MHCNMLYHDPLLFKNTTKLQIFEGKDENAKDIPHWKGPVKELYDGTYGKGSIPKLYPILKLDVT